MPRCRGLGCVASAARAADGRPVWQHDIGGLNLYPGDFSYDRRKLPGGSGRKEQRRWGHVACKDGVLYGSVANDELLVHGYPPPGSKATERAEALLAAHPRWAPNHHHPDSTTLFAMDAATGTTKWIHEAEHSIRNTTIAIGDDTLYFIDKPITVTDDYRSRLRGRTIDDARLAAMAKALAGRRGTTVEAELDKLKPGSDQGYTFPPGLRAWQERMPLSYRRLRTRCPGQAQPKVFPTAEQGQPAWTQRASTPESMQPKALSAKTLRLPAAGRTVAWTVRF